MVTSLWNGSWIAALAVGALVWGLIAWCVVAYRAQEGRRRLPEQLRYNVPIEILYTVVPLFMVAVLFFYTARDETALLDVSQKPDVTRQRRRQAVELGLQLRRGQRPTRRARRPS